MIKKKILFIGPSLIDYDSYIIRALSNEYDVKYVNSRRFVQTYKICTSILLIVFHAYGLLKKLESYCIMKDFQKFEGNQFDIVFTILGTYLNSQHVNYLKKNYPNARYCMYLWDDWKRVGCPEKEFMRKQFKYIYSFDYDDCKKYGFIFRPLFYVDNNNGGMDMKPRFDISFIGTNHSNRFEWLIKIKEICKENMLSFQFSLITSRSAYIRFIRKVPKENLDILSTKVVPYSTFLETTRRSVCVVDFPHPSQKGLTMRTIEALALGVKVLTTNESIRYHNDIPKDLYLVLDDKELNEIPSFIKKKCSSKLPDRYSLESFLRDILGESS